MWRLKYHYRLIILTTIFDTHGSLELELKNFNADMESGMKTNLHFLSFFNIKTKWFIFFYVKPLKLACLICFICGRFVLKKLSLCLRVLFPMVTAVSLQGWHVAFFYINCLIGEKGFAFLASVERSRENVSL